LSFYLTQIKSVVILFDNRLSSFMNTYKGDAMPGRKSPTFTEVELEFMHIIWDNESVSTEDMQRTLHEQGRDLSDGAIRKILSILLEKGHLTREKSGRSFIYRATVPREQADRNMVKDLLSRAFSGSVTRMVATLLNSRDISDNDIREIKRLIEKRERGE
ncbi:MAG: BlaI/MecI/CopY family transcriptional regulator, partial [Candidatus Latescibacteria bacterium]|nr:BlaI/MecI/CopY family transcriptional regulator [Candidatus Latescibacterota bacterium]